MTLHIYVLFHYLHFLICFYSVKTLPAVEMKILLCFSNVTVGRSTVHQIVSIDFFFLLNLAKTNSLFLANFQTKPVEKSDFD